MQKVNSIIAKRVVARTSRNALKLWDLSSAGRASALQAEGHRFEPYRSHVLSIMCGGIAQLARAHGSYPWCRWFKSSFRYWFSRLAPLRRSFFFNLFCVLTLRYVTVHTQRVRTVTASSPLKSPSARGLMP